MINLEDNIKKFLNRKLEIEQILSTSSLDPKEFATLSKELSDITQVTDLSSLINSKSGISKIIIFWFFFDFIKNFISLLTIG